MKKKSEAHRVKEQHSTNEFLFYLEFTRVILRNYHVQGCIGCGFSFVDVSRLPMTFRIFLIKVAVFMSIAELARHAHDYANRLCNRKRIVKMGECLNLSYFSRIIVISISIAGEN